MLEEQYHEAAGTSYTDAQASGFEIVPDDIVVKGFLQNKETVDPFDFKPFPVRRLLLRCSVSVSGFCFLRG